MIDNKINLCLLLTLLALVLLELIGTNSWRDLFVLVKILSADLEES